VSLYFFKARVVKGVELPFVFPHAADALKITNFIQNTTF